ncbi:TlpA family protein disulfide reductase [Alteribacillus iranensis]|uniref:Peroxiredoxin n=1 Tax=Alteribacillus iranensis TaxID=930128 RepID=A0A1I1ZNV4_9BACI|nr:redoxin domain-containing protein [Alteribacillus iranensis]SFE32030.1 Peroxiredoxin [Alteribacillus iranensis]
MNRKVTTAIVLGLTFIALGYVIITNIAVPKVGTNEGDLAPDYTLPMYNGEERSLSSYEDSIVIMNMWASWCEPCTREMPDLIRLHEDYEDSGVNVVTVNMNSYEKNQEEAEKFVEEFGMMSTPAMIDVDGEVADMYNLQLLPTTYIFDENRRIVEKISGETSYEQLEEKIQPLIQ